MEGLAKFFDHDLQEKPFCLYDSKGRKVYIEDWRGCQRILKYYDNGEIYFRTDYIKEFDRYEESIFDEDDNLLYFEDANGVVIDKRPWRRLNSDRSICKRD